MNELPGFAMLCTTFSRRMNAVVGTAKVSKPELRLVAIPKVGQTPTRKAASV
jgi:hypothetical protein